MRGLLTFMAKMGLSVRDDPRKVVDIAGRTWGEPAGGIALSIELKKKEDPDELAAVTVALHNRSDDSLRFVTHGWLHFFHVAILDSSGNPVELAPYGRELFKPERLPETSEMAIAPGDAVEAEIPIGMIFDLPSGQYRVRASADLAGLQPVSNEIMIRV